MCNDRIHSKKKKDQAKAPGRSSRRQPCLRCCHADPSTRFLSRTYHAVLHLEQIVCVHTVHPLHSFSKNRTKQKTLVTFIHHTDIPGTTLEVQDPIVAPATMAFAERVGVSAAVQTQRRLLLICCCWQVHALRSPRDIPNIGVGLSIGS